MEFLLSRLERYLARQGLTEAELASQLGVSLAVLRRLGACPNPQNRHEIARLAMLFGIDRVTLATVLTLP
ncbi:MAG: helix-turn-helix transcriptional regulator [Chloroflexi bacterium]|nr:helix-turn-helix transcriptional regulator [Chloroflexota bacterium]